MFTITITETKDVTKLSNPEWERGADPKDPEGYGYTPRVEKTVTVNRDIFTQTVDDLDLKKVITAINGL